MQQRADGSRCRRRTRCCSSSISCLAPALSACRCSGEGGSDRSLRSEGSGTLPSTEYEAVWWLHSIPLSYGVVRAQDLSQREMVELCAENQMYQSEEPQRDGIPRASAHVSGKPGHFGCCCWSTDPPTDRRGSISWRVYVGRRGFLFSSQGLRIGEMILLQKEKQPLVRTDVSILKFCRVLIQSRSFVVLTCD